MPGSWFRTRWSSDYRRPAKGRRLSKRATCLTASPALSPGRGLDKVLAGMGSKIDHVVSIEVAEEELVGRLTGRRTCKDCGAGFHLMFDPPKTEGVCDKCGGQLYQRDDDNEETVTNRLKVYNEQTQPLIDYYDHKSLIRPIDGIGGIGEIFREDNGGPLRPPGHIWLS